MNIKVVVTPDYDTGLLLFTDHIFVLSYAAITEFNASTGPIVSGCPVPESYYHSTVSILSPIMAYLNNPAPVALCTGPASFVSLTPHYPGT